MCSGVALNPPGSPHCGNCCYSPFYPRVQGLRRKSPVHSLSLETGAGTGSRFVWIRDLSPKGCAKSQAFSNIADYRGATLNPVLDAQDIGG